MESALATAPVDRRTVVSLFSRLRTAGGQSNPLPLYAKLRAMGEIVQAPWGGHLATSYTVCHQVLRSRSWRVPDTGWRTRQDDAGRWSAAASRQMGDTLPMLNSPYHTQVRRSLGNMFDRKSLDIMKSSVERTTERLLDRLAEELRDGPADFVALVGDELPVITIGEWLGIPPADYPLLRSLTHDQVFTQELFPSPSQLALSDAATHRLRQYFTGLVQERRRSPGDDPVSSWLRTWDALESDRHAADEAVYALALFMVLAALETTSHLLSSMVRLLLEHPQQLEWLRVHPEHIPGAIDEVLRYDAPIHMISRVAPEDTELAGVTVRRHEMVQLMVGAAHHDPDRYAEPGLFDIRRKAPHLSFGGGIHYCLGNALARLEATCLLTSLLKRLPSLRISSAPVWAPRVAFRRLMALQVAHA
ncbi:cytochrome P450 [Streptomyces inhibens]|uniref:cytochrome P450 n=1 Tax=Streptomyces inhibens TaxID=2293571 RepID=UPI001EE7538C|nr:cytochrome P450 [Streptomyces inhibens]UKY54301.1 cytochrome P450 [Streptomyces inhibens]